MKGNGQKSKHGCMYVLWYDYKEMVPARAAQVPASTVMIPAPAPPPKV